MEKTMSIELKIKAKHLALEPAIIRKEEHKLTLKDLGGEAGTNYTVSGNVMDALEAFREEQISAQDFERKQRDEANSTWFGKRNTNAGAQAPRKDDLPELDAFSRDLAGAAGVSSSSTRNRPAPRRNLGPTLQDRLIQGGIGLTAPCCVCVCGRACV